MSTSINAHVEVKLAGVWHHYHKPQFRNASLFYMMGGYPEGFGDKFLTRDRGLPEDPSAVTRLAFEREYEGRNGYGAGFLSREEIEKLETWCEQQWSLGLPWPHGFSGVFGYIAGGPLHALGDMEDGEGPPFEDVRIVFWFER